MVVKVKKIMKKLDMLKITTNLKNTFDKDEEIQNNMKK